ncbi:helix-turn-helix protein [Kerstersia gyiorum]|uniref:Helix-turn-helix protein n=1 Tax=Kerstersia gyiorum TaxID=206506 RepID=A0A4Q7MND6_9BURK|nr:helix-turn-helix domain-containing protein [Kerstersia gyiorum]KAB0543628.1 helix-turn-helix domain-containing protein [Kerstersia gyiorum]RZS70037.1 helix-turn-helix protein [Kerstersia gyiorum]
MKKQGFDPIYQQITRFSETSSQRIRTKLSNHYAWCFCELCWRTTEYSTNLDSPQVIKRLLRGNAKVVGLTPSIRDAAAEKADAIVKRYERALASSQGHQTASRLYDKYCDSIETRNDRSVTGFRDCVERITLYQEWAKHGELAWITRKPGQDETAAKPSKFYCEFHNPRRSDEARRAYQRDRRFKAEYEILMDAVWSQGINSGALPAWDIEAHAYVRREAYRLLQEVKAPRTAISNIQELLDQGMSQADIARQLNTSRQAVSAAIRRHKQRSAEPSAQKLFMK